MDCEAIYNQPVYFYTLLKNYLGNFSIKYKFTYEIKIQIMIREIFQLQNPWREKSDYSFKLKPRDIFETISLNLENELILGLIGSRQVGKSSVILLTIEHLMRKGVNPNNIYYFNLDDFVLHEIFSSLPAFFEFIGKTDEKKYILIDEIQRLPSPGLFLKEVYDLKRDIKIIFSGSSQLEIKSKTKEHLVGRARIFHVNRLSFKEYLEFASPITKKEALSQMLLYGSYPAVAKEGSILEKKLRLKDIFQSYVQKDLVDFLQIGRTDSYNKLLVRLSNQIGELLNINDLANNLSVKRAEIEKYLDILEQTFICKRVYPFHKNYNKEITKTPKIFFLDLGLRNFLLNNFSSLDTRTDKGSLFENFFLNELISNDHYGINKINFWRTTNQTEVDFIIQSEDLFEAIEVKWNNKINPKSFETLHSHYSGIKTRVVTKDDFLET